MENTQIIIFFVLLAFFIYKLYKNKQFVKDCIKLYHDQVMYIVEKKIEKNKKWMTNIIIDC